MRSKTVSLVMLGKSGSVTCLEHPGSSWCSEKMKVKTLLMTRNVVAGETAVGGNDDLSGERDDDSDDVETLVSYSFM